ncbi:hypothetical protein [Plantactinospora soyae]|uniref:Hsp70 family protein n=1 Tax=Plantactinospora soyae TaxID=1544732 RepID=A0A927LXV1_9ACTN|nr:hypothetical protein [Plantactinospora soyae]MBE1484389.1 hypothetical protein [Plantactinospora soyae]
MRVGVDLGSAFVKVALVGRDGTPVPVDHPDLVPGHGVPTLGADLPTALLNALRPIRPAEVVVAVPPDGIDQHRTSVAGVLRGVARWQVVGSPVAAVAWSRRTGEPDPGLLLTVDLGAAGCRAHVCRIETGLVGVLPAAGSADERDFGAAFDRSVLTAADEHDISHLRRARQAATPGTVRDNLAFVAGHPRFADMPIFGSGPYRVAPTLAAYEPLAARVRDLVHGTLGRVSEPVRLLVTGGMANFPPALDRVTEQATAHGVPVVEGPAERAYTTAYGAALIATGRVTVGDRLPHPVTVRSRRIATGQLVAADLPFAGNATTDGRACFAEAGGTRLEFSLDGPPSRGPLVDMRTDGTAWSAAEPDGLPANGTFHVGIRLWAGRPELVLAPADGGEPSYHRLTTHSCRENL